MLELCLPHHHLWADLWLHKQLWKWDEEPTLARHYGSSYKARIVHHSLRIYPTWILGYMSMCNRHQWSTLQIQKNFMTHARMAYRMIFQGGLKIINQWYDDRLWDFSFQVMNLHIWVKTESLREAELSKRKLAAKHSAPAAKHRRSGFKVTHRISSKDVAPRTWLSSSLK